MSKKVFLGVGHGGKDPGAVANGLKEADLNLSAALACRTYLEKNGITVLMSRYTNEDDDINQEVRECNTFKPDLALDFHTNSGGGDGFEVFHYSKGGVSKTLATNVEKEVKQLGQNSRGLKTKLGASGKDYYAFIRDVSAPSVILEMAFIDNLKDIQAFDEAHELKAYGEAVARGVLITLGVYIQEETQGTPIIAAPSATIEQCKEWARSKNATNTFIQNVDIYFQLCTNVGINPVMAYAQYALESGYGHHKGTVPESYCNPCGLKVAEGGSDTDKNDHMKFKTWEDGISAHVDHIALYVGVNGYPKANTQDPRHFRYLLGKYKTVEAIGKGWCPSNSKYGDTLIHFIKEIESAKVADIDQHKENVNVLHETGIIVSPEAWEDEKKINPEFVPGLIKNMANYIRSMS